MSDGPGARVDRRWLEWGQRCGRAPPMSTERCDASERTGAVDRHNPAMALYQERRSRIPDAGTGRGGAHGDPVSARRRPERARCCRRCAPRSASPARPHLAKSAAGSGGGPPCRCGGPRRGSRGAGHDASSGRPAGRSCATPRDRSPPAVGVARRRGGRRRESQRAAAPSSFAPSATVRRPWLASSDSLTPWTPFATDRGSQTRPPAPATRTNRIWPTRPGRSRACR